MKVANSQFLSWALIAALTIQPFSVAFAQQDPIQPGQAVPATPPGQDNPVAPATGETNGGVGGPEEADSTKIISINGAVANTHRDAIDVHQGDVIDFSADVVRTGGDCMDPGGCALNVALEQFTWGASDDEADQCNPADVDTECFDHSRFQVNDYGVSFYTPKEPWQKIIITVAYQGGEATDTVTLRNADYRADATPPPEHATLSADEYPVDATFSTESVLASVGDFIKVDGERYFAPFTDDPGPRLTRRAIGPTPWMP